MEQKLQLEEMQIELIAARAELEQRAQEDLSVVISLILLSSATPETL